MRVHNITGLSLGLALAASAAMAQQPAPAKTKSDQRISISKGDVALAPRDTVFVTRVETLTVVQRDTVRVPRLVVRTVVDTIVLPPAPMPVSERGSMYMGFYGGATTPAGNLDRLYSTGVHFGGIMGWEAAERMIGVRGRIDATQLDREGGLGAALIGARSPLMFGLGLDMKALVPGLNGWAPYAIGGLGYNYFRGLALASERSGAMCGGDGRGGCYAPAGDGDWSYEFSYGFGGGLDFDVGKQAMYLEARASIVQAHGARSWFVPVSLGARFF